jgi:hypothetical protein
VTRWPLSLLITDKLMPLQMFRCVLADIFLCISLNIHHIEKENMLQVTSVDEDFYRQHDVSEEYVVSNFRVEE